MSHLNMEIGKLRRTKSTDDLNVINRYFTSKCLKCDFYYSQNTPGSDTLLVSLEKSRKLILNLKQNNQKLRGTQMNHLQRLIKIIKEDTVISTFEIMDIIECFIEECTQTLDELNVEDIDDIDETNKQARSLLAAIKPKNLQIDGGVRDTLKKLTKKFHEYQKHLNDDKGQAPLIKRKLKLSIPKLSTRGLYLAEDGNFSLEEWNNFSEKIYKNVPLRVTLAGSMIESGCNCKDKKLKPSPDLLPKLYLPPLLVEPEDQYAEEQKVPPSPPQPADPEVSIIDHLMQSAIINKKLSEGDFNGSFQEALSHCNLALLMGACRAADPAAVFSPCRLSQAVLLSLVQQLTTDMVHDTQLKCRYLEEALINLDVANEVTRKHLPLVVEEVRKHLSKFVRAYPHHVANRRISLIIMAADNLIK